MLVATGALALMHCSTDASSSRTGGAYCRYVRWRYSLVFDVYQYHSAVRREVARMMLGDNAE